MSGFKVKVADVRQQSAFSRCFYHCAENYTPACRQMCFKAVEFKFEISKQVERYSKG